MKDKTMQKEIAVHRPTKGKEGWYTTYAVPYDSLDELTKEAIRDHGIIFDRSILPEHPNVCVVCHGAATRTCGVGIPELEIEGYAPRFQGHLYVFESCEACADVPFKDKKIAIFGRRHPFSDDFIRYINQKKSEGAALGGEKCSQYCLVCGESASKAAYQSITLKENGKEVQCFFGMCEPCSQLPNLDDLIFSQVNFAWGLRKSKARLIICEPTTKEEHQRAFIAPNAELLLQRDEEPEEAAA